MSHSVRFAPVLLGVVVAGLLVGCGSKEGSGKPASQVAVKVNAEEVSVHQLNDLLARSGNIPQDQVKSATATAVERLIDQELLVQQAKDRKLDRDPKVMQSLEFARREILARAYGDQVVSAASRPTDSQIDAFYDENPALFSKRRIYSLQELNIRVEAERFDEVRSRLQSGGNVQQLTAWLTEQNIPFSASAGTKPAEQLPLDLLKNLGQLNPGQAVASRTPTGTLVFFVAGARDEPIDRAKAKPFIETYLLNQARAELAKTEIKRLRDVATIEYIGNFKPDAAPAVKAAPAPEAPANGGDAMRAIIEKGGAGLK